MDEAINITSINDNREQWLLPNGRVVEGDMLYCLKQERFEETVRSAVKPLDKPVTLYRTHNHL